MTANPKARRGTITFPAEVNKRGSAYYITVTKSFREMLGIEDGDVVDVTLSLPDDVRCGLDVDPRLLAECDGYFESCGTTTENEVDAYLRFVLSNPDEKRTSR